MGKNFVKISLACYVSEINAFLLFTQKFKIATKSCGKTIFGKSRLATINGHNKWLENEFLGKWPVDSADTLWVKNFIRIALSSTIIEIHGFLHITQEFKMATKCRENIF